MLVDRATAGGDRIGTVTVKVARSALRIPLARGESNRGERNGHGGSDLHSPEWR
jgi:hypothetical protein